MQDRTSNSAYVHDGGPGRSAWQIADTIWD